MVSVGIALPALVGDLPERAVMGGVGAAPPVRWALSGAPVRTLTAGHGLLPLRLLAERTGLTAGISAARLPAVLVAAMTHEKGLVLARTDVAAKTNQVPRLKDLLSGLSAWVDLRGAILTVDALPWHDAPIGHTSTGLAGPARLAGQVQGTWGDRAAALDP